jgi:hypothetical protein
MTQDRIDSELLPITHNFLVPQALNIKSVKRR